MSYNQVLVAFDGSEGSMDSLKHGIQLVKEMGGEMTVVHIAKSANKDTVTPYGMGPGATSHTPAGTMQPSALPAMERSEKMREAVNKGEQILQGARNALTKEQLEGQYEVLEGDPAKRICEFAQTNDIDLIVIGNRGLSGLKKLVQGSVSQKVTQNAPCPVLVVK